MESFYAFLSDSEAVTSVEYAVMLAAIIITAIVGIIAVGGATDAMYNNIDTEMQGHGVGP